MSNQIKFESEASTPNTVVDEYAVESTKYVTGDPDVPVEPPEVPDVPDTPTDEDTSRVPMHNLHQASITPPFKIEDVEAIAKKHSIANKYPTVEGAVYLKKRPDGTVVEECYTDSHPGSGKDVETVHDDGYTYLRVSGHAPVLVPAKSDKSFISDVPQVIHDYNNLAETATFESHEIQPELKYDDYAKLSIDHCNILSPIQSYANEYGMEDVSGIIHSIRFIPSQYSNYDFDFKGILVAVGQITERGRTRPLLATLCLPIRSYSRWQIAQSYGYSDTVTNSSGISDVIGVETKPGVFLLITQDKEIAVQQCAINVGNFDWQQYRRMEYIQYTDNNLHLGIPVNESTYTVLSLGNVDTDTKQFSFAVSIQVPSYRMAGVYLFVMNFDDINSGYIMLESIAKIETMTSTQLVGKISSDGCTFSAFLMKVSGSTTQWVEQTMTCPMPFDSLGWSDSLVESAIPLTAPYIEVPSTGICFASGFGTKLEIAYLPNDPDSTTWKKLNLPKLELLLGATSTVQGVSIMDAVATNSYYPANDSTKTHLKNDYIITMFSHEADGTYLEQFKLYEDLHWRRLLRVPILGNLVPGRHLIVVGYETTATDTFPLDQSGGYYAFGPLTDTQEAILIANYGENGNLAEFRKDYENTIYQSNFVLDSDGNAYIRIPTEDIHNPGGERNGFYRRLVKDGSKIEEVRLITYNGPDRQGSGINNPNLR